MKHHLIILIFAKIFATALFANPTQISWSISGNATSVTNFSDSIEGGFVGSSSSDVDALRVEKSFLAVQSGIITVSWDLLSQHRQTGIYTGSNRLKMSFKDVRANQVLTENEVNANSSLPDHRIQGSAQFFANAGETYSYVAEGVTIGYHHRYGNPYSRVSVSFSSQTPTTAATFGNETVTLKGGAQTVGTFELNWPALPNATSVSDHSFFLAGFNVSNPVLASRLSITLEETSNSGAGLIGNVNAFLQNSQPSADPLPTQGNLSATARQLAFSIFDVDFDSHAAFQIQIYESDSSSESGDLKFDSNSINIPVSSYTIPLSVDLRSSKFYFWRVRARDGFAEDNQWGSWSSLSSFNFEDTSNVVTTFTIRSAFELVFPSEVGKKYSVQWTPSLDNPDWDYLDAYDQLGFRNLRNIDGTDSNYSIFLPIDLQQGFFRILID